MSKTKIEWASDSINVFYGCKKCSPGCQKCYAERMAQRLAAMGNVICDHVVSKFGWNGISIRNLTPLLKLKGRNKLVFVNSMSDTFYEGFDELSIDAMFDVIRNLPHTFIILTKRAKRMADYFSSREVPQNVWTGVTVCDQSEANEKIPYLLQVKSKFRFVSIEPMLGPIDLTDIIAKETDCFEDHINALYCDVDVEDDTIYQGRTTNWVICGGESGGEARPMHPDWVISLRDQCKTYDVPFMFKQWGTWAPGECVNDLKKRETVVYTDGKWDKCSDDWITEADRGPIMYKVGKNHAGRLLDGIIYDEFPGVNNVE